MPFYADLHIHSKYSRATSRDADLEHMAIAASQKGIGLIGTGDFTHPAWRAEIEEKLVPSQPGLFRLRDDIIDGLRKEISSNAIFPHFMLEVEISTIYKKDDRTRKVHHLLYAPSLDAADRIIQALARIGNLKSDGRPILGLDSRDLLEITLQSDPASYLIPAHIWTPWFAALGSKSGFDSIDHCYGDLADHIFAVETGLSSDPAMNWTLSMLDRFQFVSNSDAHSPSKVAREASLFHCELDYFAILKALKTGEGYGGTVEFFPEEGKYHLDGCRKCGVCLSPEETRELNCVCPSCGRTVTVGVMHRVSELADRPEGYQPAEAKPFRSLVPLPEILGELNAVGPNSKKVQASYQKLLAQFGSELTILESLPLDELDKADTPLLGEAIKRLRKGKVFRQAGYDGEYGTIHLFEKDELKQNAHIPLLFAIPEKHPPYCKTGKKQKKPVQQPQIKDKNQSDHSEKSLNHPPEHNSDHPESTQAHTTEPSESPQIRPESTETHSAPIDSSKSPSAPALFKDPLIGEKLPDSPSIDDPSILMALDQEQRAAAQVTEGPLLIIAGPGTGKTRTLTHRIAYLIQQKSVPSASILALTFTQRAASEMTERLDALLPRAHTQPAVMTFHALGHHILRQNAHLLDLSPDFQLPSEVERIALLSELLKLSTKEARKLLGSISRVYSHPQKQTDDEVLAAEKAYASEMRRRSWVDFDHLIAFAIELLEHNAELRDQYREQYRWISVDEYQDIDPRQYRLLRLLNPEGQGLCVIGDPDQSIYRFRGTDLTFFQRFAKDFSGATTIQLTRNYRSSPTILKAALQSIEPSTLIPGRKLLAQKTHNAPILYHQAHSERAEAEFIVHTIERQIGGSTFFSFDSRRVQDDAEAERSFADFAILYRTESQTAALIEALDRSGIPFQKRSHQALLQSTANQELIAAARSLPVDQPLSQHLKQAASSLDVKEARDWEWMLSTVLQPLITAADNDLEAFAASLAIRSEVDLWDARADRVSLLTLHAAKGLEFEVVFMVGCEDGLLPLHWGNTPESEAIEEERRLCFVGMTRARERLILSHAAKRMVHGKPLERKRSHFLDAVDTSLLKEDRLPERRWAKPKSRVKQLELF